MGIDFSGADISFAGCGFMCIYHAGVSAALKEYAPQLVSNRIYGASAGAIAAAALICDVCISEATSAILQVICEARAGFFQALTPTFDLLGLARDGMERILPEDAHIRCSGRLHLSLTRYDDGKNVTISNFSSKEDLIQAILCSCFIPVFCGAHVPFFHGVRYIDGGFSDNQPRFNERTITISPFSGESDICPIDYDSASFLDCLFYNTSFRFTSSNLFRLCSCFAPPSQDICSRFCQQGFTDALRFLTRNAVTPCINCLTIQSNSLPLPIYGTDSKKDKRWRLDTECEVCLEKVGVGLTENATALFPKRMQRTLELTKPKGPNFFQYISSFRIIKWSLGLMFPIIASLNYATAFLKLIKTWKNADSKYNILWNRLQFLIDFILSEVEDKNLLWSSKFNILPSEAPTVSTSKTKAEFIETQDQTKYLNDDDSVDRLIDYAENHNAILAFHYLDNHNNIQVCEIFDINRQEPHVKCHTTKRNDSHLRKRQNKHTLSSKNGLFAQKALVIAENNELNDKSISKNSTDFENISQSNSSKNILKKQKNQNVLLTNINNSYKENENNINAQTIPPDPDYSQLPIIQDSFKQNQQFKFKRFHTISNSMNFYRLNKTTSLHSSSAFTYNENSINRMRWLSSSRSLKTPITLSNKPRKRIALSKSQNDVADDDLFVVSNKSLNLIKSNGYEDESDTTLREIGSNSN